MFLFSLVLVFTSTKAQTDSLSTFPDSVRRHSPKKAALLSTVLPGLGQAYNKKYWKIPVIYAGIGTCTWMAIANGQRYKDFREGYNFLINNDTIEYYSMYGTNFTVSGLEEGKDYYRRYRDLFVIFTAGVYLLNIIDASVDAYLFDFDISDDLSLQIQPATGYTACNGQYIGLRMNLRIKK